METHRGMSSQLVLSINKVSHIKRGVFGIPIKLSTAYTYTENFRSKTNQAKRHHEGRGLNPGISLRKSTRDGQKHKSINSH
jgi:hypothetical protein